MRKPAAPPPNRIRELREERGWSQAKLGSSCMPAMTATQIWKREIGRTRLKAEDLYSIARALEVAWWDLLPLPPVKPEEQALIGLYRGLAEPDRKTVFRVADALAKSAERSDTPETSENNSG